MFFFLWKEMVGQQDGLILNLKNNKQGKWLNHQSMLAASRQIRPHIQVQLYGAQFTQNRPGSCITWTANNSCRRAGRRRRSCWTSASTHASWAAPACWRWSPPCTPGSSPPRSTETSLPSYTRAMCPENNFEQVNSWIHQACEQKRDISVKTVLHFTLPSGNLRLPVQTNKLAV